MFVANDPIHQFHINEIVSLKFANGLDLSITNSTVYMWLAFAIIIGLMMLGTRKLSLVPGKIQSIVELSYGFIAGMIKDVNGEEGLRFFPLIFSLFMFILVANIIGMFPYAFTTTSHIIVTAFLAMLVISIVIGFGVYKHGFKFLKIFVPSGIPWPLYIIVVPIEIFSFISRPLSLAVRLFANILAGHIMLKVFAGFIPALLGAGILTGVVAIPAFLLTTALQALELLVAFLQAYVFAVLTSVYLNDALHPGH